MTILCRHGSKLSARRDHLRRLCSEWPPPVRIADGAGTLLPDEKINASDCVTQFIAGQGFEEPQQSTFMQTRRRKPARRTERTDRRAKIPLQRRRRHPLSRRRRTHAAHRRRSALQATSFPARHVMSLAIPCPSTASLPMPSPPFQRARRRSASPSRSLTGFAAPKPPRPVSQPNFPKPLCPFSASIFRKCSAATSPPNSAGARFPHSD